MRVTWFGTAALRIEAGAGEEAATILVDPFVPKTGSKVSTTVHDFRGVREIVITHGHLDHIGSLPGIATYDTRIFCTKTPADTLAATGIERSCLNVIAPGDVMRFGPLTVTAYQGRHVTFDGKLLATTALSPRTLGNMRDFRGLLAEHLAMPENGETLGFLVEADGKSVFILGSLGLDEAADCPTGMDLLVLPFQGSSHLLELAANIVEQLRPKAVMLDHFDDTFPPLSRDVDTSGFIRKFRPRFPVIHPQHRVPYEV